MGVEQAAPVGEIVLITTGGTIASSFDQVAGDVRANTSGTQLADIARRQIPYLNLTSVEFSTVGSFVLDLDTAFQLVKRVDAELRRGEVRGVVVTHGTDTLEETAFLCDLVVTSDKPVVFTGSQRALDEPDSDGPRNLCNAIRVAMSKEARGLGTLVVFEDEIHGARDATKTHTSQVRTFQSGEHGKLGEIDGDSIIIQRLRRRRPTFPCTRIENRIDLVKLALGSDGRFIDFAIASGARGVVLEAFGRGNATPAALESVQRAAERQIPVIVTSRCPKGRVAPVYGQSGGAGLKRARAIFAGDLTSIKARILLAVLLGEPDCASNLEELVQSVSD